MRNIAGTLDAGHGPISSITPPLATAPARARQLLTIHVEDYFQTGSMSGVISRDSWHRFENRIESNLQTTLDLLDGLNARATFFMLGWIAERLPTVCVEIVGRGHELAALGHMHHSIGQLDPVSFRDDIRRAKAMLEHSSGQQILGYRVARDWFRSADLWTLEILKEEGYLYDSSFRPFGWGWRDRHHRAASAEVVRVNDGFYEIPLTTISILGFRWPISGGNYMRQLPDRFVRRAIERWISREESPFLLYFHTWELDPTQPRIGAASYIQQLRQYRNLDEMPSRIRRYLSSYQFNSIAQELDLTPLRRMQLDPARQPPVTLKATSPAKKPRQKTRITIVVPCYNEENSLGYLANTIAELVDHVAGVMDLDFIFVDDGSKDATWLRLQELFSGPRFTVLRHDRNQGVTAAMMTGIRTARTEIVGVMDCDCSYDPLLFAEMLPLLTENVAMVTASPYHPDGLVKNVAGGRLVLSKGLSAMYALVLNNDLSTYTSCFRLYRRAAIAEIRIENAGFLGIAEALGRLDMQGAKIAEYPAQLEARLLDRSKMKIFHTIWGHLRLLGKLVLMRLWSARRKSSRYHLQDQS